MRGFSARPRVSAKSVTLFGLLVALSCAEQEDDGVEFSKSADAGGSSGTGGKGSGGTVPVAGTSNSGGKGGTTASGGSAGSAGKGGSSSTGGSAGTTGSGGNNTSGSSSSGGSGSAGSPALGCDMNEGGAGGMPGEGGAPGAAGSNDSAGAAGAPGAAGAAGEPGGAGAGGDGAAGAAGANGGPISLFFDDFEDGNADGWEVAGGTWGVITDGSLVYQQSLLENQRQFSMVTGSCWADQIVEARMKITTTTGQSNSYIGAIFARALNANSHYMLAIGSDGKLVLRKRVNSTSNSATQIGTTYSPTPKLAHSTWYTLKLEVIGSTLNGYLDGTLRVTATDSSIASGGVAVGTVNRAAVFDDVRVTAP